MAGDKDKKVTERGRRGEWVGCYFKSKQIERSLSLSFKGSVLFFHLDTNLSYKIELVSKMVKYYCS